MTIAVTLAGKLKRDNRGIALLEFGLCLPLLLIVTLWTFEYVNYCIVVQQISQLALQVSDNAARIGTQNSIQTQIDEKQINDLFQGAGLQSGPLALAQNGRVMLTSLEVDADQPHGQYLHWQRCYGALHYQSSYGRQGAGKGNNDVNGMGPGNARIVAAPGSPAMFVEIFYRYQPLISARFAPADTIHEIAAMMVRDNRDTSDPGVNPVDGVQASMC